MRVYITSDDYDKASDLRELVLRLKALPFPTKIFLVSKGRYRWELALGLGVTGVLEKTPSQVGDTVLGHIRLIKDNDIP